MPHKCTQAVPPAQSATQAEHTRSECIALTTPTATGGDWLTEIEILKRIPVCRRTIKDWRDAGTLPYVRLPGSRRVIYHWPTVEGALLRHQRGGGQ
jgi:hypothetical protein